MAITADDFNKIWASTSPLTPYEFSESNYKEGWNFIGGTPPSRQMWDFLQKQNDEKLKYLLNNFDDYAKKTDLDDYLPLAGGTLTGDVLGVTPPNGDNSKKLANTEFIQALASILVPVGCVQAFAGSTTPDGWLLCDGSAVSRTDYAELYSVIGDTYGDGDGSTTFNLPNLVDKFVEGSATAGTEKQAGLPNITGGFFELDYGGHSWKVVTFGGNAIYGERDTSTPLASANSSGGTAPEGINNRIRFDASRSSAIYGASDTVQPPALTMQYIIKY